MNVLNARQTLFSVVCATVGDLWDKLLIGSEDVAYSNCDVWVDCVLIRSLPHSVLSYQL